MPMNITLVEQLEDILSQPTPADVEAMRGRSGDLLILGVAGKMGPSLARRARRACDAAGVSRRIIGASRFSSEGSREALERSGIETLSADLLAPGALDALPDAPNVVYMAARKFGSTGDEAYTWAMNTYLPARVAERFARSRIVAFSTGNDDNIVADLLTPYRFAGRTLRIVGGLLGHWAVWTRQAVQMLDRIHALIADGDGVNEDWLSLNVEVTDANAAFFDAANNYRGCIAGIHEVLRRQGLLEGAWCLNPDEGLSPGQAEEIDRVCRAYPHLADDEFVAAHRDQWMGSCP